MQKTLTRTIGEGTFWITINNASLKVVWLITTFFVLRELTVYAYGLATLVLSLVPIFSFFLLSSLDRVMIADMGILKGRGKFGSAKKLLKNYFLLQTVLGILIWVAIFFGADIISNYYEGKIDLLLKILSFSFLVIPLKTTYNIVFNVNLNFFTQSAYSFVEEISKMIIVLVALFVFNFGVVGLIFAHVSASFVSAIIFLPFFFKSFRTLRSSEDDNDNLNVWDLIKSHGKWSMFSSYLGQLDSKARLWILQLLIGTEAVGLFAVARGLFGHVVSLIPLNKVVAPIIPQYTDDKRRFANIINKVIKYQLLGFILIGVIGFFLFPPIIIYLFPNYVLSMNLFKILIFALIPSSLGQVFWPTFLALQEQKKLFFANILKFVGMLVMLPTLVYLFNLNGVAYEFILSVTFFLIVRYFLLKKIMPYLRFSFRSFFTLDQDDRIILGKIKENLKKLMSFSNPFRV